MIYVTEVDPVTREATKPSVDSGFKSIADVVALMGKPMVQGRRSATYLSRFYSDYTFWEQIS